jgi:uncharacterized protein (DUF433 family)
VGKRRGALIELGEGVYTVPEIARILQPNMTVDRVRYWLHKGLLGEPLRWGSTGRPHLLSFEQLLRVRTIQDLREKLNFPLQKVTPVIEELSNVVFLNKDWHNLRFFPTPKGEIGVHDGDVTYEVMTHQLMIPDAVLPELEDIVREARKDWVQGEVGIKDYPRLVSNPRIVAGSPTIRGTRVETSFIAHLVQSLGVERVLELYPHLDREAVLQATKFEGSGPLAA